MGMFDKLAFWKKKDDEFGLNDLDKSLNMPTGLPSGGEQSAGSGGSLGSNLNLNSQPFSQQQSQFQQPQQFEFSQPQYNSYQQDQSYTLQKEMEVISIKLDAIKAAIENISQRLANLERFAYNNNEQASYRQYYREMPPRSY